MTKTISKTLMAEFVLSDDDRRYVNIGSFITAAKIPWSHVESTMCRTHSRIQSAIISYSAIASPDSALNEALFQDGDSLALVFLDLENLSLWVHFGFVVEVCRLLNITFEFEFLLDLFERTTGATIEELRLPGIINDAKVDNLRVRFAFLDKAVVNLSYDTSALSLNTCCDVATGDCCINLDVDSLKVVQGILEVEREFTRSELTASAEFLAGIKARLDVNYPAHVSSR